MSKGRRPLGRGLEAILGPEGEEDDPQRIREIPVADIVPNPHQPRKEFDEDSLRELAESIRVHGLVQPIVVVEGNGGYTLVAGERRWRAARLAGWKRIPALVRKLDAGEMTEVALIENLQREDLTPLEEALAYQTLQEDFGLTQEEVAQRVGKSRSQIANTLRLLTLDKDIQEWIHQGALSMGHAKLLLSIASPSLQRKWARETIENGWTVRALSERIAKGKSSGELPRSRNTAKSDASASAVGDPHWQDAGEKLRQALGTRVELRPDRNGQRGRIIIEFFSPEEFERLFDLLTGNGTR